jgi:hypothetical protein
LKNIPNKIKLLQDIGITAPDILIRINEIRNKMEHEFQPPKEENVKNAIDIAELFYYATNRLTRLFIDEMDVWGQDIEKFTIKYDIEIQTIEIIIYGKEKLVEPKEGSLPALLNMPTRETFSFKIKSEDASFFKWLKLIIQIQS